MQTCTCSNTGCMQTCTCSNTGCMQTCTCSNTGCMQTCSFRKHWLHAAQSTRVHTCTHIPWHTASATRLPSLQRAKGIRSTLALPGCTHAHTHCTHPHQPPQANHTFAATVQCTHAHAPSHTPTHANTTAFSPAHIIHSHTTKGAVLQVRAVPAYWLIQVPRGSECCAPT
jgi:hypothetical protein